MAAQHGGQRLQLRAGVGGSGRVGRTVQDQPLRSRRDRGLQRLGAQLEAVGLVSDHGHRLATGQQHHIRIGHPVRRRHDHLVPRREGGQKGVVDHRLAARRHVDLAGLVGQPVLPGELGRHRRLQLRNAVDVGVFGLAAADGGDGRFLDIVRRVEVRFAGAQSDHVAALPLQLARTGRHRQGGGRLDAGEGGGLQAGHGDSGDGVHSLSSQGWAIKSPPLPPRQPSGRYRGGIGVSGVSASQ